jgi:phosphoribosylaminoimidazolecarboxamide formyltransferase/IMP cyclohydrolase
LHGKQLSYNNINDAPAAWELALALKMLDPTRVGACVIKHTNPCGAAMTGGAGAAVDLAIAVTRWAAYGGILALNARLDDAAADRICREDVFLEVIIAPDFAPSALEKLRARWTGVRLLAIRRSQAHGDAEGPITAPSPAHAGAGPRRGDAVPGQVDARRRTRADRAPTGDRRFPGGRRPFRGSNAIVVGGADHRGPCASMDIGSGQVDRVSACRLAVQKAGALAKVQSQPATPSSPSPTARRSLIDAGVSMIVPPRRSKRDADTSPSATPLVTCHDHGNAALQALTHNERGPRRKSGLNGAPRFAAD